ncbi:MAG TPA: hypothetical protein VFP44_07845 [Usitatibacter sp.]|nr:hypothetical protein [Usitatibacter sp.]HET9653629.1 hypothetical protein [Usitatibacter sp.]
MDIRSSVFYPSKPGEPFLILASALPGRDQRGAVLPFKREVAPSLEEAMIKSCELARSLKDLCERMGYDVGAMRCSHCPTPLAPTCGVTSRHRPLFGA